MLVGNIKVQAFLSNSSILKLYGFHQLRIPIEGNLVASWSNINKSTKQTGLRIGYAMGNSEKATSVVVGGQVRKWGDSYYYSLSTGDVYLGSSREDAIETLREYESMASTKDQVWPVIILNSTSCARVTNVNELGAKTAYVNPLDGGQQMSLYQLYLKKHLKALEK